MKPNQLPMFRDGQFTVHLAYKAGMNPVLTEYLYISSDYKDCFDHIATRDYPASKKVKIVVKQIGSRHRWYSFDERFYAQWLAGQEVQPEHFYEEDTEKVSVQLDKRKGFAPVVWRGLSKGRAPVIEDEIPF